MREFWYRSDGADLYAVDDGAGPAVVMLHGALGDHVASRTLIRHLSGRYRTVTPDLRGSGRSIWRDELSFSMLSEDLARLMDHLGIGKAVVGGNSFGSSVATHFALNHPQRTVGLIVSAPIHSGADEGLTSEQKDQFDRVSAVAARTPIEGLSVMQELFPELREPLRSLAFSSFEGFDPLSVVSSSRFLASGSQPFETAARLSGIHVPSLLISGIDEIHSPSISALYQRHLTGCSSIPIGSPEQQDCISAFVDRCWKAASEPA